jgi:uracil-DNA glycosylase
MARKAEWEKLKERSAKRFGEDSVFGEGTLGSRLAVVGEAPGKREVEEGRPFVGNAGRLLDELLDEAGIERSKVYVTNVVKVRPTKENNGRTQNRPPRARSVRGSRFSRRSSASSNRAPWYSSSARRRRP